MERRTLCKRCRAKAGREIEKRRSVLLAESFLAVIMLAAMPSLGATIPRKQSAAQTDTPAAKATASFEPRHMTCESQVNPLAIQAVHPHFSWILDAPEEPRRGLRQTAYRILVDSSLDALSQNAGRLWDSGKIDSDRTIQIEYAGQPLLAGHTYYWKVRVWDQDGKWSPWSEPAKWTMGLLQPQDWKAKWIAAEPDSEADAAQDSREPFADTGKPLPIFRRAFRLQKAVRQAIVYASGLGQYELLLNGKDVTGSVLNPGWTNYRKTVLYNTYDVTRLLLPGKNALGVLLGNGMYNVQKTPGRYTKFVGSFGEPKFILQMRVVFTDGSETTVTSDASWKTASGPITFSSTYGGEDFDARREPPGWGLPSFNDSEWAEAEEVNGPGGQLIPQYEPPIEVMHTYEPVNVTEPKPGILIYDLGQNFSGWPLVVLRGPAGAIVELTPGELLDENGLVEQRGSGGPAYFSYTLNGGREEIWHPRFSYYGFRYVQVEGASGKSTPSPDKPVVVALKGEFLHSSAPETGAFSASDNLFDGIHKLIETAIMSNMQSILTDCPHREKLGWLEETHLLGEAVTFDFDSSLLYDQIADDMDDSQLSDGLVPDTAPEYVVFPGGFRDSPEWGSASILDPWLAYRHYGDIRILSAHYDMMRRYVDYLTGKADDHIISYGLGDWYDIGPGEPGGSKLTSRGVTATAMYYLDLTVLQKIALLLGKAADAQEYANLARAVSAAFNAKFFNEQTNSYDTGSQTALAMPLVVGLVPENHRQAVLDNLVQDIRKHGDHVTAGDIGFPFVVQALTDGGRSDVLFNMLSRTDPPSYGSQLKAGATTLTEAWDANPRHSQDHFMLGDAEDWFYRGLAGIDFDLSRSSSERIVIKPALVGDIASAGATYASVLGTIGSNWKRESGKLSFDVTIPVNSVAMVYLPVREGATILESGKPLSSAPGVKLLRFESNSAVLEVGSGKYHFEAHE
ncbi:MAG: family 78 glycoside hydrolase catalytic domain [Candidatus Acidiferrales bacterium]